MARKGEWEWEDHLAQVLLAKPAEVVQEACQVLEKHGCPVKKLKSEFYSAPYLILCTPVKELKSELYYSSALCQVLFQVLHYANLIVTHAPTAQTCTSSRLVEGCIPNLT